MEAGGGADEAAAALEGKAATRLGVLELIEVGKVAIDERRIGERPEMLGWLQLECDRGLFYLPTILSNVNHDMRIARENIFGPVYAILARDFSIRHVGGGGIACQRYHLRSGACSFPKKLIHPIG